MGGFFFAISTKPTAENLSELGSAPNSDLERGMPYFIRSRSHVGAQLLMWGGHDAKWLWSSTYPAYQFKNQNVAERCYFNVAMRYATKHVVVELVTDRGEILLSSDGPLLEQLARCAE